MKNVFIEQLTITSDEGLPIRATLHVPEKPRAVVFVVHGFKGFRNWGFFPWVAEQFAALRLVVCRFDFSRNGVGEGGDDFDRLDLFENDTYSIQLADLRTVVREIAHRREFANLPTFLFGHSRGGGVAILAAAEMPRLHGVVVWAPIAATDRWDDGTRSEWRRKGFMEFVNARTQQTMRSSTAILDDVEANRGRLDIMAAASRLRVPLLVVHGLADESVPPDEGKQIAARAPNASLMLLSSASHTFGAIHPLIHVPKALRLAAHGSGRFIRAHC